MFLYTFYVIIQDKTIIVNRVSGHAFLIKVNLEIMEQCADLRKICLKLSKGMNIMLIRVGVGGLGASCTMSSRYRKERSIAEGLCFCGVMSWSWNNPSEEEAEEAYAYYKSKYNSAASQKRSSERLEQTYVSEKKNAVSQRNQLREQKLDFEDRLEGIKKIIEMLEGRGGWFTANVPDTITKVQRSLKTADSSFRSCVKLTGGVSAASMETAFAVKTVEADSRSASALQEFRRERDRLEGEILELNRRINSLSDQISSLTSKINSCNSEQSSLQRSMNSFAYDMNHYKKYTY